jgi:purine-binding chemotaxis protein CheW
MATQQMAATEAAANAQKYLSFCLGEEHYGVEILRVREIIGLIAITPLPQAPNYVRGVMNLRGRIIPVIDLRSKFGLKPTEATKETCIIVMEGGDGTTGDAVVMGVIVDSVREVQDIPSSSIEPPPEFGCEVPLDYIHGMGKVKDKVIVLLDIVQVLSTAEVPSLEQGDESGAARTKG